MILTASLIGGWDKLELWGHTHMALFGLLFMVCAFEVVLLKMTTSAGLFNYRPHHTDPDYDDSSEYEEDIYYEDLQSNYDQWARRQMRYRQRQQQQHEQQMMQQNRQYQENDNHHSTAATGVFRYVY